MSKIRNSNVSTPKETSKILNVNPKTLMIKNVKSMSENEIDELDRKIIEVLKSIENIKKK
jgi:hypothetical protein